MKILRHLPRFRKAYQAIKRINAFRERDANSIKKHQLDRLNRLWGSASRNVEYFRGLKADLNLPEHFQSIEQFCKSVPITEKQQVRDSREIFLSNQEIKGRWLRTGGSTGVPTSVFWSHDAHFRNLQLRYAWISRFGVDIFDQQAFLWGHSGSFAPGFKGRVQRVRQPIEDRLRNRDRFSAYQIGAADIDRYLQQMIKSKTRLVYGYSSVIMLVAKRAKETGVEVDTLKLLVMTGEPAMPGYEQIVFDAFGAPGKVEYGSVECGIIALQSRNGELEIQDNSRLVETVPRGDGFYDILITVLDNPGFPLMRYRIGDTTSQPISLGSNGFSVLKDVQGRSNDFLVGRDGGHVHANAVKHALEHVPKVDRFRAIQNADGALEVLIENEDAKKPIDEDQIISRLKALLGGYEVNVKRVPVIQGNLAGKHSWVISQMYTNTLA